MSLSPFISHGSSLATPLFLEFDCVERLEALDSASVKYSCSDRHHFVKGQLLANPSGVDGLWYIEDIKSKMDGPVWDLDLQCLGLSTGKTERHLKGSPEPRPNGTDWDSINVTLLTNNPFRFTPGQLAGGVGISVVAMACQSWSAKPLDTHSNWYIGTAELQGIIAYKQASRQISATGRTITGDSVIWQLPGGWNTPRPAEVSLAQVTVVDTLFSTTPPPTGLVPGSVTPPGAPPVKLFNVVSDNARALWPNGWVFTPASEQPWSAVSLYKHTWTYVWTPAAVPA